MKIISEFAICLLFLSIRPMFPFNLPQFAGIQIDQFPTIGCINPQVFLVGIVFKMAKSHGQRTAIHFKHWAVAGNSMRMAKHLNTGQCRNGKLLKNVRKNILKNISKLLNLSLGWRMTAINHQSTALLPNLHCKLEMVVGMGFVIAND
jgi:hypothetical protein